MDQGGPSSIVHRPSSILVIGLGNPILGDDGVGWRVAEEVHRRISNTQYPVAEKGLGIRDCKVEVDCVSLGGLSLMERMVGYDRAILIDAIATGQMPAGTVTRFALEELPDSSAGHTTSAHDTSLHTALEIGRAMGARLPDQVTVVAIESPHVYDFSEELSPPVAAAVPRAADVVLAALETQPIPMEE